MQHPYFLHLSNDPGFKKVLENAVPRELKTRQNIPLFLYMQIINQQLSTRVGEVFYERFLALFGGNEPTPLQVVNMPPETLQSIGLSRSKTGYIQNIARFEIDNGLGYDKLSQLTDDEVGQYVGAIKGIGPWSIHNLLMFGLGREDIFSGDDLIIRNAMASLFNLDKTNKKKFKEDINRLSDEWSPYRTFACLHLWQWYSKK
jgi:DNA-3-methyladenine glycosylase II